MTTPRRKLLAWTAIVPILAVGLAGCQASDDTTEKRPKSTKGAVAEPTTTSTANGGGLPFGDPGTETPTSQAPTPQSSSPTASGTTPGGGDVVKWDGVDLSDIDWDVVCYTGASPSIYGADAAHPGATDSPSFMITTDAQGAVDWLMVTTNTQPPEALYFTKPSDGSPQHGSAEMTFDGTRATITGEAYDFMDYSYNTPKKFELQLTCDTAL